MKGVLGYHISKKFVSQFLASTLRYRGHCKKDIKVSEKIPLYSYAGKLET
jgi:hypothetical protein